jgi:mediator of RNA polymerase II transcription subunit 13, fungi type
MANPKVYQVPQTNGSRPNRRALLQSHFDSNLFQPGLNIADSRYNATGFFWFEPKEGEIPRGGDSADPTLSIPRVGIPKKERIVHVPEIRRDSEPPESSSSAEGTDFDSSEFFSDSNKRDTPDKLNGDETESLAVSPQPTDETLDSETESRIREEVASLLELLRPEVNEQMAWRNHQPLQRQSSPSLAMSREKLLPVAQVMVDQLSQGLFYCDCPTPSSPESEPRGLDMVQQLQSIYGDATELDLAKLADLSTPIQDSVDGNGLAESPSPFIRLGRADVSVQSLPTIQPFWETLGLQPISGKKNITAICIHPAGTHIGEGSSAFLQRLGEIYLNCNLGSHNIGSLEDVTSNGLIEWHVEKKPRMDELLKICERLGSSLTALPSSAENVMIYMINPYEDKVALADICNSFVALFTKYAKACGKSRGSEVNLQIIPMSFIASSDTVVIPSQAEYLSLALEVYNRCPVTNPSGAIAESGAAVMLGEPIPKNITFNLTSDATSPLSKDGEILHLAYSQSVDLRWITASWTDNLGKTALTMTYCLRQKGSSASRPRSEVIKEMWEISHDIMIKTRGKWRLSVAHDGAIGPDEINEWLFLANPNASSGAGAHCILTLLTFNEQPSIQFFPPTPQSKPQPLAVATAAGKYGTPASTPSAGAMISSPEQLTASTPIPPTPGASGLLTAPTPPDQSSQSQPHGFDTTTDPDATLIDPRDECWSLVLPFGLNNSRSPLDSLPALQSGFLLKRYGPHDSDGLVALGVNLVYASSEDTTPTKAEQKALLRDVIVRWRGLYTLARTKGLGEEGVVLPWHVRTAVRGCRAVSEAL